MTYYRDDDEYDREQAYREQVRQVYAEARLLRVPCPYCSTLGCPACAGRGFTVTEESK